MTEHEDQLIVNDALLDLDESSPSRRRSIARRLAPSVASSLRTTSQQLQSAKRTWRRVVSSLDGRILSAEEEPIHRPEFRQKEFAARWAFWASIAFDFLVGATIATTAFRLPIAWAVLAGLALTLTVALLAKGLAGLAVQYQQLSHWTTKLLKAAGVAFALVLLAVVAIYLVQNGLLPTSLIGLVMPALVVACAIQAGSFSALRSIYGHPRELVDEVRRLETRHAELQVLESEVRDATEEAAPEDPVGNGHASPRRRLNGRFPSTATRALSIAVLLAAAPLGVSRAGESHEGSRFTILADASDSGEMSNESGRVNRLLAGHGDVLVDGLGDVTAIVLVRWSDAPSVWQAGRVFEFPRLSRRKTLGEERLPLFTSAHAAEEARHQERERELRQPIFKQIGEALIAPIEAKATRSCVRDALNRASELPAQDFVLVVSDLAAFRCPTAARPNPDGPTIGIVQIPRREADARERMLERRRAIEKTYPNVHVIESYLLTDAASLRAFALELRQAGERRRGQ